MASALQLRCCRGVSGRLAFPLWKRTVPSFFSLSLSLSLSFSLFACSRVLPGCTHAFLPVVKDTVGMVHHFISIHRFYVCVCVCMCVPFSYHYLFLCMGHGYHAYHLLSFFLGGG